MASITITTTPQSFAALVGADGSLTNQAIVWQGRCQNTHPADSVYRVRAMTQPAAGVPAFKHGPGEVWDMDVYRDVDGATWLWSLYGNVVIVYEGVT